ncbi:MAG: nicotinate-nucleotide adenylyltransferase [Armatimonadetes bacterium]|nr:nicotinate-nucleotide adenylyltransferase [Armatimonadota bacterium]
MRRIAVMGGTFDPVHTGHLVVAEEARARFALDQVIFVPAAVPPHKQRADISSGEDRYAMVLLATASNPFFAVSRIELQRPGPSYTIDTIREFRAAFGPEAALYFITGADAVLEILTWHHPEAIIRECRFIAAARPGYDLQQMTRRLPKHFQAAIDTLVAPGVDVSSSEIRRRVREGVPIRYLTPEPVEDYIRKNNLYVG